MGTRVAVQLWATDPELAGRAIDAVMADMRRTDELMSTYKPESQLSQVNAHAYERPVQVDADIIDVVEKSLEYSRLSDGAFDITYASVGYLYDYRAHVHPTDAQIDVRAAGGRLPPAAASTARPARSASCARACASTSAASPRAGAVDRGVEILQRARHRARDGQRRRRHAAARRPPRQALDRRHPRSAQGRRRRHAHPARRTRRSRPPATTSATSRRTASATTTSSCRAPGTSPGAVRSVTIIGADRDAHRRPHEARVRARCRARHGIRAPRRGVEAVIVDDEGRIFYSPGLEPAAIGDCARIRRNTVTQCRLRGIRHRRRLTGAAAADNDSRD